MNVKAERIDHLMQIINRNLLLIYAGQSNAITPMEHKPTHRIDLNLFSGDKFGYEMINFVRTFPKSKSNTMAAIWDRNFLKGLENLIVECAVIKDEVERDCFVSHVYVWFTDKLMERRDIVEKAGLKIDEFAALKESIAMFGGNHTMKALENYESNFLHKEEVEVKPQQPVVAAYESNLHLPEVKQRTRRVPDYVKMATPNILKVDRKLELVNKIGLHDEDGEPVSEAEKIMHDLWLARRQQEAFEWKARQNVDLMMDRRALSKSRLESEELRKQETSAYLAAPDDAADDSDSHSKYAPKMRRPLSGRRNYQEAIDTVSKEAVGKESSEANLKVIKDNTITEEKLSTLSRKVVPKKKKQSFVPMIFKIDLPDGYSRKNSRAEATSADDSKLVLTGKKELITPKSTTDRQRPFTSEDAFPSTAPTNRRSSNKEKDTRASIIHVDPMKPIDVVISKRMNEIAFMDKEMQIHKIFSRVRKMPLTAEHKQWLKAEEDRAKPPKKKVELNASLSQKNIPTSRKSLKEQDKESTTASETKPVCKYKSAEEFMDHHFPKFDGDDHVDAQGPLRTNQIMECNAVYDCLSAVCPNQSIKAIENALITPQDRPLAICLKNMRNNLDCVMENPLPKELWRKPRPESGAKKKKKKQKQNQ